MAGRMGSKALFATKKPKPVPVFGTGKTHQASVTLLRGITPGRAWPPHAPHVRPFRPCRPRCCWAWPRAAPAAGVQTCTW
eukprot:1139693-Pelagomonas_calceolata.AAC.1